VRSCKEGQSRQAKTNLPILHQEEENENLERTRGLVPGGKENSGGHPKANLRLSLKKESSPLLTGNRRNVYFKKNAQEKRHSREKKTRLKGHFFKAGAAKVARSRAGKERTGTE